MDDHSVSHRVVAGCEEALIALHLHDADPAGTDLIEVLQITDSRDPDTGFLRGLQDGRLLRHFDGSAVDDHIYH